MARSARRRTSRERGADSGGSVIPRPLGHRCWALPEGYIPTGSTGPAPQLTSHETLCLLNTSARRARVAIHVYFSDREPAGPYRVQVPPRRTLHLRFNDLVDPEPIPRDTDFASVVVSDVRIVVQHTRLDSRQSANALLSTIAFPVPESAQRAGRQADADFGGE